MTRNLLCIPVFCRFDLNIGVILFEQVRLGDIEMLTERLVSSVVHGV